VLIWWAAQIGGGRVMVVRVVQQKPRGGLG
jgi:hypothetical protein